MPFLFDGYNVYHAAIKLSEEWSGITPGTLCKLITEDMQRLGDFATVVFDGTPGPGRSDEVEPRGYVKILYSGGGKDADTLLEKLIKKNTAPRRLFVVSSDNRLCRAARRRRSISLKSIEYLLSMLQRIEAPAPKPREPREKRTGVPQGELNQWLELFGIDTEKPDDDLYI